MNKSQQLKNSSIVCSDITQTMMSIESSSLKWVFSVAVYPTQYGGDAKS